MFSNQSMQQGLFFADPLFSDENDDLPLDLTS